MKVRAVAPRSFEGCSIGAISPVTKSRSPSWSPLRPSAGCCSAIGIGSELRYKDG